MRTKRVHAHLPVVASLHRSLWMTAKLLIKLGSFAGLVLVEAVKACFYLLVSNPRGPADLIADKTGEYKRSYHEFELKL